MIEHLPFYSKGRHDLFIKYTAGIVFYYPGADTEFWKRGGRGSG